MSFSSDSLSRISQFFSQEMHFFIKESELNLAGAPVLWAAAAAGHLDIVRYLIEEGGADINQTTLSNSSPLRGACYDGHFEIGINYSLIMWLIRL